MIREARLEDIPNILHMGRAFFEENNWPAGVEFSADTLEATLISLIQGDSGKIFIDSDYLGAVGGMTYPFYFTGQLAGCEFFWWVSPEARGGLGLQLFKHLEQWFKQKGATTSTMIALESSSPDKVGNFYEKQGYKLMEHHYMRVL